MRGLNGKTAIVAGGATLIGQAVAATLAGYGTKVVIADIDLAGGETAVAKLGDKGRGLVDPSQTGAFRTPSLRNVALRTSFFHDGSATDLAATFAHSGVTLSPDEQRQLIDLLDRVAGD